MKYFRFAKTLDNWLKLAGKNCDLRPITGFQKGHSHGIKYLEGFRKFVNNHPDYTQQQIPNIFLSVLQLLAEQ